MGNKILPTKRQKAVFKKVFKGGKSIHSAMKDVYAESSAKNPKNITQSKGWQELMEKYLPDKKLAQVHRYLLNHKDWRAKDAGLDKGYKIKGRYAPSDTSERVEKVIIEIVSPKGDVSLKKDEGKT